MFISDMNNPYFYFGYEGTLGFESALYQELVVCDLITRIIETGYFAEAD